MYECLCAAAEGPFFPDWEFQLLFGLERARVAEIVARCPIRWRLHPAGGLRYHPRMGESFRVGARGLGVGGWRRRVLAIVLSAALAGAVQSAPARGAEQLLDAFEFGGSVELAYERRQNFDLDSKIADDVDLLPVELQLELLFEPSDYLEAYVEATLVREFELREEGAGEARETELLIEEAYVTLRDPDRGLALQVGRQTFEDERQWLYDEELDAVRASYRGSGAALELSLSRKALVDEDLLNEVKEEPITNYMLVGAYAPNDQVTLGAYGIVRDDRGRGGDPVYFYGLSSKGTIGDRLDFWLDVAQVRGREEGVDLRGTGLDILALYRIDASFRPHLLLGYAYGSGDTDPDDRHDGAFRQTGLQGNEAELGGPTAFSFYGEAFDPELSNMSILTAGLGARPREGISLDLVYHVYRQDKALDELGDNALEAEPTGDSRRLGSEIDLVIGFEEIEDFRIGGFLGYFMPGRAFGPGADDALFARIEVEYEF
jgi:alginate production protein